MDLTLKLEILGKSMDLALKTADLWLKLQIYGFLTE